MTSPVEPSTAPIIDGLVLSAGRSRRMGRPKALLPIDEETFIERAIRVLIEGGCREVFAVVPADAPGVTRLAEQAGARIVVNPDVDSDQATSLRLGLEAVGDDADAVAVLPVDHPLISSETVLRLLSKYREARPAIVRPVYCGVPGHPGIFSRRLFPELLDPDLPEGAHTVIEAHRDEVVDVEVRDIGVTADIDSPDDYRRLVEGTC